MTSAQARREVVKTKTTTKATHRDIEIIVLSDRIGHQRMFTCTNSRNKTSEGDWFPTQGEAIANERREIDRLLG
jgi:ABC-type multidrug transport system permease subunit